MSEQQSSFIHTCLDSKLQEQLNDALKFINTLSQEDIMRCDNGCLIEFVRQYAIAPPFLRLDLVVADEMIIEAENIISERKTGDTCHSFFIPIEKEAKYLEEVRDQKSPFDDCPLAFLDEKRSRIRIRLMVSPKDEEGLLKRNLDLRIRLVEQYSISVTEIIIKFNKDLAEKMITELNTRKNAIIKAEKELGNIEIPRVYNPEHVETAIQIERLLKNLGGVYMTDSYSRNKEPRKQEIRSFIVHGHDQLSLYELKDYLQNTLKLPEPVILRQMPGLGKTMIEKFEREAEMIELVFVLLTPDDKVASPDDSESKKHRARQNVIFELGFFLSKLGRASGKILLLHKGPIEIPSDISGIEYIDISNGIENAGKRIRKELKALGVLK
jgi:predicted nucleotide-binding protein